MLYFDKILQNLMFIEGTKKAADIIRALKVESPQFYMWKKRNTIPTEKLLEYCNERGISLNWLLTGEGKIYHQKIPEGLVAEDIVEYRRLVKKNKALVKEKAILDKKLYKIAETLDKLDDEARDMMLNSFLTILKAKTS